MRMRKQKNAKKKKQPTSPTSQAGSKEVSAHSAAWAGSAALFGRGPTPWLLKVRKKKHLFSFFVIIPSPFKGKIENQILMYKWRFGGDNLHRILFIKAQSPSEEHTHTHTRAHREKMLMKLSKSTILPRMLTCLCLWPHNPPEAWRWKRPPTMTQKWSLLSCNGSESDFSLGKCHILSPFWFTCLWRPNVCFGAACN